MTRTYEIVTEGSAAEAFIFDELVSLGVETMTFDADDGTSYALIKALTKAAGPKGFEVVTEPKGSTTTILVRRKRAGHKFSQASCPVSYHERLKTDPTLFRAETHPGGRREDEEERFEVGHCKRCGSTLELATRKNPPAWAKDKDIWYRAEEKVKPYWKKYREPYAVVVETYKRMGGR